MALPWDATTLTPGGGNRRSFRSGRGRGIRRRSHHFRFPPLWQGSAGTSVRPFGVRSDALPSRSAACSDHTAPATSVPSKAACLTPRWLLGKPLRRAPDQGPALGSRRSGHQAAFLPRVLQQGDLSKPSRLSRQCRRPHEPRHHSAQATYRCARLIVTATRLQAVLNGPCEKNL